MNPSSPPPLQEAPAQSDGKPKKAAPAAKGKGDKGAAAGASLDSTFVFHPTSMDLKMDETQDLTVWAFPTAEGPVEDVIVAKIKDNPVPVEFPVTVIGGRPLVLVRTQRGAGRRPSVSMYVNGGSAERGGGQCTVTAFYSD